LQVEFEDCRKKLLDRAEGEASQRYREWRERSGYGAVVEFV
jgi:hypothetical protein